MKTKIKFATILSALLFGLFAFKSPETKKIIVIDAGHGGDDFGASLNGLQEKTIVETIAKKIKDQNKNQNLEIVLLREGDHFIELSERVSIINNINPNLVISLHINSSTNINKNGVEAYISSNKTFYNQSKTNAEVLVDKVAGNYFSKNEVKEASFYILKNSNCPALTLEVGYLSNVNDRNYITSEKGQDEIAAKILDAVK
ncbi:N-acetylmuramoyl-L-alanine amidase [Flavobacterium zhairuonense]|uniref:N-acetylmuramoyl-L-alanine amidase family protein n=1 Tax=Flavobacterium zhairuonense TaxID=2493631 RepID=UPI001042ACD2|nr:N-acetylmuramoyl-L-alanine amidase [Flavobacterium zhairuonense]KAF2514033.1 N-acetylmuramoyl-L-alanine amidase [Flavobacterium zhairuonense]